MNKYEITSEEYELAKKLAKINKHKQIERRLRVIILRYEGKSLTEIADQLGYNRSWVVRLLAQVKSTGLEEYSRMKYQSNRRNLSPEREKLVLDRMREQAERGELVTAKEIQEALEKELGRKANHDYAYDVMKRHGWRKVMPRPEHPKKATEEEIEASKKLIKRWIP